MKYYQLSVQPWDSSRKSYPLATGRTVSDKHLFDRRQYMSRTKCLIDSPVFDYFSLMSISIPGPYDWALIDVYNFSGTESPIIYGFMISEKCKNILEQFSILSPFTFYESKLMYQGEKHKYFVFQLASKFSENLNYEKTTWQYSEFFSKEERKDYYKVISSAKEYNNGIELMENKDYCVFPKKAVFKKYSDFFFIFSVHYFAVSERLKNAFEKAGLIGFDFTPIEHIDFEFEEGVPQ